jgi:hypothetical protein
MTESQSNNVKVLSFDVGTINFALCHLEYNATKSTFNILTWDVINLLQEENYTCGCLNKGGIKCTSPAKHCANFNGRMKYYCGTHSRNQYLLDAEQCITERCTTAPTKSTCSYINSKNVECGKKAQWINQEGGCFCTAHKKIYEDRIEKQKALTKVTKIDTDNVNKVYLKTLLINNLEQCNETNHIFDVNNILIENQPINTGKNNHFGDAVANSVAMINNVKAHDIQMTLETFFLMKGFSHENINRMSASGKLKIDNKISSEVIKKYVSYKIKQGKQSAKDEYHARKDISVAVTYLILENLGMTHWIDHIRKYKKQDDICDAFLQAIYFASNNKYRVDFSCDVIMNKILALGLLKPAKQTIEKYLDCSESSSDTNLELTNDPITNTTDYDDITL